MRLWEQQQRKEGATISHGTAKELLAAAVGFEVDKLVETKGLDFVDRERAKRHATQQAEHLYDEHYGGQDQYDPCVHTYPGGTSENWRIVADLDLAVYSYQQSQPDHFGRY